MGDQAFIPEDELVRLEEAVADAEDLAQHGAVMAGYELLDLMLSWAESPAFDLETGEVSAPEPWAAALIQRCRAALMSYAQSHDVSFPLPDSTPLTPQERIASAPERSRRLRATSADLTHQCRVLRRKRPSAAASRRLPWTTCRRW